MGKMQFYIGLFQLMLIVCSCGNGRLHEEKKTDTLSIYSDVFTEDTIIESVVKNKVLTPPKLITAKFEGAYDVLENDFQYLEDSLKSELFNLTVAFCGDTIILNGNQKALVTRYTVGTKDMYSQCTPCQKAIFKYFGKRAINVSDSIDYLSLSERINVPDFTYTLPGIVYERPYLIIPFHGLYMASFIVEIESTENNRIMPERRKR